MTELRSDEVIQKDVLAELKWDAQLQPNEIGVTVKDGVVTLTGRVDSFNKKWAAEQAALRVRGVKAVANDIEIRLPGDAERTDSELAAAAVHAIEADAVLRDEDINVVVSKGWVTLKGEVEWNYQKEDAERIVRRLWGVKGVTNLLTVKAKPTSQEIKDQIEKALVRDAQTDARRISVEVDGNKVTLKGTVRSWAEREEAERVAWTAPGITRVDNQIVISF
jgi:osmotically-inducible protein OsmY